MIEVTTTGCSHSHVGSQAYGDVHHRLVDVFLWQPFRDGLQGDFQLIRSSKASAGVFGTSPAWHTTRGGPAGSNVESLWATPSRWIQDSSLAASSAWRSNAEKRGLCFLNSVSLSFSDICQQNLAAKCIFYCLTVMENIIQKSASVAEISTKVTEGLLFYVHPAL